jgi:hypothetical protein
MYNQPHAISLPRQSLSISHSKLIQILELLHFEIQAAPLSFSRSSLQRNLPQGQEHNDEKNFGPDNLSGIVDDTGSPAGFGSASFVIACYQGMGERFKPRGRKYEAAGESEPGASQTYTYTYTYTSTARVFSGQQDL